MAPRVGDVHHGGSGAPSLAEPGRDEGCRKGTLPRRPGDTVEGFAQQFLEFALSQETARTETLLPPVEGREENPLFRSVPPLVQGPGMIYLPTHLWPVPFGTQGVR